MKRKYLRIEVVKAFVDSLPSGSFFTVTFDKVNGEERQMNCRQEVKKHLAGGGQKNEKPDLVTTYSIDAAGYRSFYANRVKRITGAKEILEVRS